MTISSLVARLPSIGGPPSWWKGLREFFAYHGIWAPGVRLLRLMTIRSKVLMLLTIVAAPTVPLTWSVVHEQQATVAESNRQLAAVRLSGAASDLAHVLNSRLRNAEKDQLLAREIVQAAATHLRQAAADAMEAEVPIRQAWERAEPTLMSVTPATDATADGGARQDLSAADLRVIVALGELRQSVAKIGRAHV